MLNAPSGKNSPLGVQRGQQALLFRCYQALGRVPRRVIVREYPKVDVAAPQQSTSNAPGPPAHTSDGSIATLSNCRRRCPWPGTIGIPGICCGLGDRRKFSSPEEIRAKAPSRQAVRRCAANGRPPVDSACPVIALCHSRNDRGQRHRRKEVAERTRSSDRDTTLFFNSLFTPREIRCCGTAQRRIENVEKRAASDAHELRRAYGAQRAVRLARHPAGVMSRSSRCSASPYASVEFSTERWLSTATSGNGTISVPGRTTTTCRSRGFEHRDFPSTRSTSSMSSPAGTSWRPRCGARHIDHHYPLWTINHATNHESLVQRGGIVAPKGPAGSMLLFSLVPGARLDIEPVWGYAALLPEPVRGIQSYPALQASRVHRAPRLRRCPAARLPIALPWRDSRKRRCSRRSPAERGRRLEPSRQTQRARCAGQPAGRIIGTGRFGQL